MAEDFHDLFDYLPTCHDKSDQGSINRVFISDIRLTQNAAGFAEIDKKRGLPGYRG